MFGYYRFLSLVLILVCFLLRTIAFSPHTSFSFRKNSPSKNSSLHAVTPIGPFCVFRSTAAQDLDPFMKRFAAKAPSAAREIYEENVKMVDALKKNQKPERDTLLRISELSDQAVEDWEQMTTRWRLSQDFQIREYGSLTYATLAREGETVESVAAMMRFQAAGMRAMANNEPLPAASAEDYRRFQEKKERLRSMTTNIKPSMSTSFAPMITAPPFKAETAAALESPTVRSELEKLQNDHKSLIQFGGRYGTFDPLGKISFIDEIEKIEERWDVFFARFNLMGLLNDEYVRQCNEFLAVQGLDEADFRKLLRETHDIMRLNAEKERT